MIKLDATALKTHAERYLSASKTVDDDFRVAMDDAGRFTLKLLQRKVNVKTGRLRDSMQYQLVKTSTGYQVKFIATAKADSDGSYYVNYVDQGTVPHYIRAKNVRALHFIDKSGTERFCQTVYHPGYKGSHFSDRSVTEASRHADVVMRQLAKTIGKRVAG